MRCQHVERSRTQAAPFDQSLDGNTDEPLQDRDHSCQVRRGQPILSQESLPLPLFHRIRRKRSR